MEKKILDRFNEYLSELIHQQTKEGLFEVMVYHLEDLLYVDDIQVATLIEYSNDIYMDKREYLTKRYKHYEFSCNIDKILKDFDSEQLAKFRHSDDFIYFMENSMLCKFDSSYGQNGYLYFEIQVKPSDYWHIMNYLNSVIIQLDRITSKEKLIEEKKRLYISLSQLLKRRDERISNHVSRVAKATKILAAKCGYYDEQLENIVLASSIHDIGKMIIPDAIINKPGQLSDEEYEIIKSHTTNDFEIIDSNQKSVSACVHNVIRYHHENWDGSGYPSGLTEEYIPIEARIVSVVDVFEALTHDRPYKKAWSYKKAIRFINHNKAIKFDPEIVNFFNAVSFEIFNMFLNFKGA